VTFASSRQRPQIRVRFIVPPFDSETVPTLTYYHPNTMLGTPYSKRMQIPDNWRQRGIVSRNGNGYVCAQRVLLQNHVAGLGKFHEILLVFIHEPQDRSLGKHECSEATKDKENSNKNDYAKWHAEFHLEGEIKPKRQIQATVIWQGRRAAASPPVQRAERARPRCNSRATLRR
jgi:hypothetical protein